MVAALHLLTKPPPSQELALKVVSTFKLYIVLFSPINLDKFVNGLKTFDPKSTFSINFIVPGFVPAQLARSNGEYISLVPSSVIGVILVLPSHFGARRTPSNVTFARR